MRPVVVWGNCQAEPLGTLLAPALERHGLQVLRMPPVFLATADNVRELHEILSGAAVLISQPVSDEYAVPGCGTNLLSALLPPDATVVTFPVTYDTSLFPFQVDAHRGDGSRIDAPLTDYHDLRVIVAAERGLTVHEALSWWPVPAAAAVRTHAADSIAEMARREASLDVAVSDLLPQVRMFTMSHPDNRLLGAVANRVLRVLGCDDEIELPQREFLGARRAPVETAVLEALGRDPDSSSPEWVIEGRTIALEEILAVQLPFYAAHLDIIEDARVRFAERLELFGL